MWHLEAVGGLEEGYWRDQPQRCDVEVKRRVYLHQSNIVTFNVVETSPMRFLDIKRKKKNDRGQEGKR